MLEVALPLVLLMLLTLMVYIAEIVFLVTVSCAILKECALFVKVGFCSTPTDSVLLHVQLIMSQILSLPPDASKHHK